MDSKQWTHDNEVNELIYNKLNKAPMFVCHRYNDLASAPLLDQFGFCPTSCAEEQDDLREPCAGCCKSYCYFLRQLDEYVSLRSGEVNLKNK